MPFGLGFGETILIFGVVLLFFGPRKLPEFASGLGKGIRDFRRAMNGVADELRTDAAESPEAQRQTFPASAPVLPPPSEAVASGGAPVSLAAEPVSLATEPAPAVAAEPAPAAEPVPTEQPRPAMA